jgi:hypothetical protein
MLMSMLIAARHLVDRMRHPRTRADEVRDVRRRLVASDATDEEVELARELARLRVAMIEAIGSVSSCSGCARGRSLPHGRWDGGHCCGGRTEDIFTDDELAALRLAGTTPARLTLPPPSDHAGCAFRGPEGCSLAVVDRPSLCVRFLCRELEAELSSSSEWPRVKKLRRALGETFTRFANLRAQPSRQSQTCTVVPTVPICSGRVSQR